MSGAIIVFRWEATVMDNMKKILKKMPKVMKFTEKPVKRVLTKKSK